MTRGIDDGAMRGGLPRQFRYISNRRQCILSDWRSIHIAGTFAGDEQRVVVYRQIIEYREHPMGWKRHVASKYQAGGAARRPGINKVASYRTGHRANDTETPQRNLDKRFHRIFPVIP
jgi:hypothetical protein